MKIIQNVQVVSPIDRGDHYRKIIFEGKTMNIE